MTKNVSLCGMGGQSTVLVSRLTALTTVEKGMEVRGAEIIGMAQRGGSMVGHVCISGEMYSPLTSHGGADVIIGFEPIETVRCLSYLKKGGCVMASPALTQPVTAPLIGGVYMSREMMEYLEHAEGNLVVVDVTPIGVECGSPKVMNMALLGTVIVSGLIGISLGEVEAAIEKRVPEKSKDANMKTLRLGAVISAMVG